MSKKSSTPPKISPVAFHQYNQAKFQRTVRLTKQAIAKLEAEGQTVTLAAVSEATRMVDEGGKGLTPTTILRNPQAAELFRQHSPAYQARQHKAPGKGSPTPVAKETRAQYRGLRSSDLLQMIEDLKKQLATLKTQRDKLKSERDEAYRARDEALRQNTQQLAVLTQLMNKTRPTEGER